MEVDAARRASDQHLLGIVIATDLALLSRLLLSPETDQDTVFPIGHVIQKGARRGNVVADVAAVFFQQEASNLEKG